MSPGQIRRYFFCFAWAQDTTKTYRTGPTRCLGRLRRSLKLEACGLGGLTTQEPRSQESGLGTRNRHRNRNRNRDRNRMHRNSNSNNDNTPDSAVTDSQRRRASDSSFTMFLVSSFQQIASNRSGDPVILPLVRRWQFHDPRRTRRGWDEKGTSRDFSPVAFCGWWRVLDPVAAVILRLLIGVSLACQKFFVLGRVSGPH